MLQDTQETQFNCLVFLTYNRSDHYWYFVSNEITLFDLTWTVAQRLLKHGRFNEFQQIMYFFKFLLLPEE